MKIAAYCRVSTDHKDQLNSLANQKEFFESFAQKNGHTLYRVYADEGISGTSLRKRKAFQELMSDSEKGLFDMVVAKDISRFARNTVDLLQNVRALKARGINTVFLTANMDSMGDSEFLLTIFGAIAQEESANLSKRVKWGKKINAEKGRVPPRIFGYDRIDNFTLRINDGEAAVVREIFRMYLEDGMGSRLIAIRLNEQGIQTKYGCEWNQRGVRRLLTNSIYCGHYVNHRYEVKNFLTGERGMLPEEDAFEHERPEWAIVSKKDFDEAKRIMHERYVQYSVKPDECASKGGGRYSNKHVFSTLIKCSECGRSFGRHTMVYKNTYKYWYCSTNNVYTSKRCSNKTRLREEVLLNELKDYLSQELKNRDEFVKQTVNEYLSSMPKKDKCSSVVSQEQLQKKKDALKKRREKYQEMFACDMMTAEELRKKLAEIKAELIPIEDAMQETKEERMTKEALKESAEYLAKEIETFLSLEEITNQDMRKILDHITVTPDKQVTFYLKKISEIRNK